MKSISGQRSPNTPEFASSICVFGGIMMDYIQRKLNIASLTIILICLAIRALCFLFCGI